MTREEDIKKFISVIIVITIILAIFIGVRVLTGDDKTSGEVYKPTPTPTLTPDVDTSLDDEEEVTEGEKNPSSNVDKVVVDNTTKVEVVKPIQPVEEMKPADKILLREKVLEVEDFINKITVSEKVDLNLAVMLGELTEVLEEVTKVFENEEAKQEEVDLAKDTLSKKLTLVEEYIKTLEKDVEKSVVDLEQIISSENLKQAKELVESLPVGDVREILEERIKAVTDVMIIPVYSTTDATNGDVIVTIKVTKEFVEELEGWLLINAEEKLYQRVFTENTTDTLVPIRYVDNKEEYVDIIITNIDKEGPTSTIENNKVYNENVVLDFEDVNQVKEIKVLKDHVSYEVIDNTLTEEGVYQVEVTDKLGNKTTLEFTIDKKGISYIDTNNLPVELLINEENEIVIDKTSFEDLDLTVLEDNSKTLVEVQYVLIDNENQEEKIMDDLTNKFLKDKLINIKEIKVNLIYTDLEETYRVTLN